MKTCFKCQSEKPLTEFYIHPFTKDRRAGKCKVCTRKDVAANLAKRMLDPEFRLKEAARHRKKAIKQRQKQGYKVDPLKKREAMLEWYQNNPEKRAAHRATRQAIKSGKMNVFPCSKCGAINSEAHHEDYTKPLEVVWLCPKHHAERHVEINDAKRLLTN
jgi:hypothetical protein